MPLLLPQHLHNIFGTPIQSADINLNLILYACSFQFSICILNWQFENWILSTHFPYAGMWKMWKIWKIWISNNCCVMLIWSLLDLCNKFQLTFEINFSIIHLNFLTKTQSNHLYFCSSILSRRWNKIFALHLQCQSKLILCKYTWMLVFDVWQELHN